ncbi:hypothetical protein ACF0H5_020031 [Mactra antiquata]
MFKSKYKRYDLRRDSYKTAESRFFQAIKAGENDVVEENMADENFVAYLQEQDKISLAFVQVVLLNNVQLVKILLKYGVDIHATDSLFEENGIMHAARYGHNEMLECLLSCGLGINHQSENGSTALHVAVENGKHDTLQILVQQKGVDLNIQDCSGLSPLLWCARLRDWKAMAILVDAGCNLESRDYHLGVNCLHILVDRERVFWKGKFATVDDINKCIDTCIDGGLDINKGDVYGNSAFVYAVRSSNLPAVKYLLKRNCSVEGNTDSTGSGAAFHFHENLSCTNTSLLPLYIAMSKCMLKCVYILCSAGVKYHQLADEPNILAFLETAYPPLYEVLVDLLSRPVSLKQTCRNVIRSSMTGNIMKKASQLHLPNELADYICLSDIDPI